MSRYMPTMEELMEARENGETIQIWNGSDVESDDWPNDVPLVKEYIKQGRYHIKRPVESFKKSELWDAAPNCIHELDPRCYSGIRCLKCNGWYCL